MIQIDVKISDNTKKYLASVQRELRKYPGEALDKFKELTPIRTGNARRRTRLSGDTIQADYAYAQRLDDGASTQAPRGMTEPFVKWAQARARKIFGK
jgi:hypothetical protein